MYEKHLASSSYASYDRKYLINVTAKKKKRINDEQSRQILPKYEIFSHLTSTITV